MKIAFNTYSAAFQCPGGGEIQLLKSKEALEQRGHEVVLFNQWMHKLEDFDVVHQFAVQGGTYNLSAYSHDNSIPLVLSPILWLNQDLSRYPMSEIKFMMEMADVICPNSEAEIQRFIRNFDIPSHKYHLTYNGVDSIFFNAANPDLFFREYKLREPFILCVANIEQRKNQLALLEAAAELNLHVVLIGNIRDNDYYGAIKSRFHRFSYLGYMDHGSEIFRSAYSAATVFALPSLLETPGLAALEAAAVGLPLVITREGCTEEYFGSDGFYVDPNSIADISAKITLAIKKGKSMSGLKLRAKNFSWNRVAEQLEAAYIKALTINSARR